VHLEQVVDGRLQLGLYEPELLVHLVPQDLPEDCDVVVAGGVLLDARNDVAGCLDGEALQAVLLVEVGEEVLVHGLAGQLALEVLFVELEFGVVDFLDGVLELLDGEALIGGVVVVAAADAGLPGDLAHLVEVAADALHVPPRLALPRPLQLRLLCPRLEGLDEGHALGESVALRVLEDGVGQLLVVGFQLGDLSDEFVLLLAHALQLLLHDGVLIDDRVLRLELVVVALVVLLLLLVELDASQRQRQLWVDWGIHETSLKRRS
jgi:hypothetical protein